VTTEQDSLRHDVKVLVDAILSDNRNYIVIYPNNDAGSEYIFDEYERFRECGTCKIYPSMRFEYFLTLLKHADFIIGNSSAGVREAPFYGVPCINIGTRQMERAKAKTIIHSGTSLDELKDALGKVNSVQRTKEALFGDGKSYEIFLNILENDAIWQTGSQKYFVDLNS
jgi:UDP-N-acetylglucosamine 2-epimerase (hydrolysing)